MKKKKNQISTFDRLRAFAYGEKIPKSSNPKSFGLLSKLSFKKLNKLSISSPSLYRMSLIAFVFFCLVFLFLLMTILTELPLYGSLDSPALNEVTDRYLTHGLEETGSINLVTGILLDYRAFDTLGETIILFLVFSAISLLLFHQKEDLDDAEVRFIKQEDKKNPVSTILSTVSLILFPCILLYGIYILLNGHLSPGGGFSGGVILSSGLILLSNASCSKPLDRFLNITNIRRIISIGLLIYAFTKGISFFAGANHISLNIPLGTPGAILSAGLIPLLNVCVGLVVSCTIYGLYRLFIRGDI